MLQITVSCVMKYWFKCVKCDTYTGAGSNWLCMSGCRQACTVHKHIQMVHPVHVCTFFKLVLSCTVLHVSVTIIDWNSGLQGAMLFLCVTWWPYKLPHHTSHCFLCSAHGLTCRITSYKMSGMSWTVHIAESLLLYVVVIDWCHARSRCQVNSDNDIVLMTALWTMC